MKNVLHFAEQGVWLLCDPLNGFGGGPGYKALAKFLLFNLELGWPKTIKRKLFVSNKKLLL